MGRFELPTSRSRTVRSSLTELHPAEASPYHHWRNHILADSLKGVEAQLTAGTRRPARFEGSLLRRTQAVRLANARCVESAVADGLLDIQVAVSDLDVETAGGVGTCPGLKVDGCPLAAEIG